MQYRFADFCLDVARFTLSKSTGEVIEIQPRSLELLLLLIRNAGELVPKETIVQEIWSGLHTSPNVIPVQVSKVRAALGDTSEPYQLIETVPRKGLRFIGKIENVRARIGETASTPEPLTDPGPLAPTNSALLGKKPKIAVLRFNELDQTQNLSGLANALPADIITALSRLQLLNVIAGASSFRLDAKSSSPLLVKSALGADYCLGGSVARAGRDYAIYAELVDTETQALVWSQHFEVVPQDIHEWRNQVVGQVISSVERQVSRHEAQRLRLRQPVSMTAWQAFHMGSAFAYRRGEENMARARTYFERAVAIDPDFARAWAGLAQTYSFDFTNQTEAVRMEQAPRLLKIAERAVEADPDDPAAALAIGWALTNTQSEGDPKIWFDQALEAAPSYALAHQQLGITLAYQGRPDEAKEHASTSLLLSPQGTERFSNFITFALSALRAGDLEAAVDWGRKAAAAPYDDLHILLTGICASHWGQDTDQAKGFALRLRKAFPGLTRSDIFALQTTVGDGALPMVEDVLTTYGIV